MSAGCNVRVTSPSPAGGGSDTIPNPRTRQPRLIYSVGPLARRPASLAYIEHYILSGPNGTPFHPHVSTEGRSNHTTELLVQAGIVHLNNLSTENSDT